MQACPGCAQANKETGHLGEAGTRKVGSCRQAPWANAGKWGRENQQGSRCKIKTGRGAGERKGGCPKGEENSVSYLGLGLWPGAVGQGMGRESKACALEVLAEPVFPSLCLFFYPCRRFQSTKTSPRVPGTGSCTNSGTGTIFAASPTPEP